MPAFADYEHDAYGFWISIGDRLIGSTDSLAAANAAIAEANQQLAELIPAAGVSILHMPEVRSLEDHPRPAVSFRG